MKSAWKSQREADALSRKGSLHESTAHYKRNVFKCQGEVTGEERFMRMNELAQCFNVNPQTMYAPVGQADTGFGWSGELLEKTLFGRRMTGRGQS
jgi:hypothetical protein